jgi:hypothetical protein
LHTCKCPEEDEFYGDPDATGTNKCQKCTGDKVPSDNGYNCECPPDSRFFSTTGTCLCNKSAKTLVNGKCRCANDNETYKEVGSGVFECKTCAAGLIGNPAKDGECICPPGKNTKIDDTAGLKCVCAIIGGTLDGDQCKCAEN